MANNNQGQAANNLAARVYSNPQATNWMQNGSPGTATLVNMGDMFAGPKYANTSSLQGIAEASAGFPQSKMQQMWDTNAAKATYDYLQPEQKAIVNAYATSILGHSKFNDATANSYYQKAIDGAAQEGVIFGNNIDVWSYMGRKVQSYLDGGGSLSGSGGSGGGGGGGGGGGPSTTTQYNLTNKTDATMLVDQALTQYLGREATPKEREKFWSTLNNAQMKNPNVAHSSGGANPTVTQSGGLNTQQAAKEFAMSRKDAAEYMANTQYTDWLMEMASADPTEGMASGL